MKFKIIQVTKKGSEGFRNIHRSEYSWDLLVFVVNYKNSVGYDMNVRAYYKLYRDPRLYVNKVATWKTLWNINADLYTIENGYGKDDLHTTILVGHQGIIGFDRNSEYDKKVVWEREWKDDAMEYKFDLLQRNINFKHYREIMGNIKKKVGG